MEKTIKKLIILLLFILLFTIQLNAQDNNVFAPFVSRLKAINQGSSIALTWEDSEDLSGSLLIYRYIEEITNTNFSKAELLDSVPYGTEAYIDHPVTITPFFYAVIIQTNDNKLYDLFIPFRNKTIASISITEIGMPEELATTITNIRSISSEKDITISFSSSQPKRELIMYRSNEPIINNRSIIKSVSWILDLEIMQYTDVPPAGLDYYYAVLDLELLASGKIILAQGQNSTQAPVHIPISESQITTGETTNLRSRPFPLLMIQTEIETGNKLSSPLIHLPKEQLLNSGTTKAISKLLAQINFTERPQMSVNILEIDKVNGQIGEDFILSKILDEKLNNGLYQNAIESIQNFLSIHHSDDTILRARFYLGQAYYFAEYYEKAFLEFLLIRDDYYVKSNTWMDACLGKLIEGNNP